MMKSGLEKIFWNSSMPKAFFGKSFLLPRNVDFYTNCKFSNKNYLLCAWRDFYKTFCGISTYHKWMFKLQISSIFKFDRAHQSWISGLLGVKHFFKVNCFFEKFPVFKLSIQPFFTVPLWYVRFPDDMGTKLLWAMHTIQEKEWTYVMPAIFLHIWVSQRDQSFYGVAFAF